MRCKTLLFLLCFALCAQGAHIGASAAPLKKEEEIRKAIEAEQGKAGQRRESLKKLTARERALNSNLAKLEKRIDLLTKEVAEKEKELARLESAQGKNRSRFDELNRKKAGIERDISSLMRFLWPLYMHQESVGARDGLAWHEAEQQYQWTMSVMRAIGERQRDLEKRERELKENLSEKEKIALELKSQVASVNTAKDALLADMLKFNRELEHIRQEKLDVEDSLSRITKTVQSLNIRLQEIRSGGDLKKLKGSLPWPATGRLVRRYAPSANPPVRGFGIALKDRANVRSVAAGKVVYNDMLRGLGQVVILMHGKEYYTVYAHLADILVNMGQEVPQGHLLGHAGFYPPANGPGLYFELRFHQKAINPDGWLSKQ